MVKDLRFHQTDLVKDVCLYGCGGTSACAYMCVFPYVYVCKSMVYLYAEDGRLNGVGGRKMRVYFQYCT